MMDDSKKTEDFSKGWAKIKPAFLVVDHVRELDPTYLNPADRLKLEQKDTAATADGTKPETLDPPKKVKLKGRNKKRAGNVMREAIKACSYLVRGEPCPFGEKCRYSHDAEAYMQQKPADIGDKCPNFARKGVCPYGFTCRFEKSHAQLVDPNGLPAEPVKIPRELFAVSDEINGLTPSLMRMLRKRKFEFGDDRNSERGLEKAVPRSVDLERETEDDVVLSGVPALPRPIGGVTDEEEIRLRPEEKKAVDFRGKLYLSPLTTVGNLPYRRICKRLGADITCGEMALAGNLLAGQQSEWALMVRHASEDFFGVQVCGSKPDVMEKLAYLVKSEVKVDFVDINCGCPIDLVCNSGSGCAIMGRQQRMEGVVRNMSRVLNVPLTVKMRTGIQDGKNIAHELIPRVREWGASLVSLHGRSREQRYTRSADWDYIAQCAEVAAPMPLFGNGDCMNFEDYYEHMENSKIAGILVARGALIKPWIFTEIKERRHWDISANERLDIFKEYANNGLEHWGTDTRGVENTRRFLLEWMSFTHRYIPVGVLERIPQRINERPPYYCGRSDLETLLSSAHCRDWIKVTEMLLGPVPDGFTFLPKHKANAWK